MLPLKACSVYNPVLSESVYFYNLCLFFMIDKVQAAGSPVEEFARLIVSAAVRGSANVKYPSWYDVFLLYRVFAPDVLTWTFRFLLSNQGVRATSFMGTGRPLLEASSPPKRLLTGGESRTSPRLQLRQLDE